MIDVQRVVEEIQTAVTELNEEGIACSFDPSSLTVNVIKQ